MRFISTKAHGIIDYLVGFSLLIFPFYFEFNGSSRYFVIALGASVLLYSALTDYEFGAIRYLRVRFHLFMDFILAVALVLFSFLSDGPAQARWFFAVIALCAVALIFTTKVRAEGTASETSLGEEAT
jgi:hypothetical protein